MSGYRTLHRQQVCGGTSSTGTDVDAAAAIPIWQVQASSCGKDSSSWRIWTASADGRVYSYLVQEKQEGGVSGGDDSNNINLNAAAMNLTCTHVLRGTTQTTATITSGSNSTALGCTQVSMVRNYVGDDDMAGDWVIASMELAGRVRIWTFGQEELLLEKKGKDEPSQQQSSSPTSLVATHEFQVDNATGTTLALCPPKLTGNGNVMAAVGCLDGSIVLVATALITPQSKLKNPPSAGTILESWGSGAAIPTRLKWHPSQRVLAVGRQDGTVDLYGGSNEQQEGKRRLHRLLHHSTPVRAVAFTTDGQVLITGSDEGLLCVWDMNRKVPALVHHVVQAHKSWILDVTTLADSRRFVTCSADQQVHVWSLGQQAYAPLHTFACDANTSTPWTITCVPRCDRLVVGTDRGWLIICSLAEK